MYKTILLVLTTFNIWQSSCKENNEIFTYERSHAKYDTSGSNFLPTSPQRMLIFNDSVIVQDYEHYIPAKKGIIKNHKFIFEEKDTVEYLIKDKYIITIDDSLFYFWIKK